MDFTIVMKYRKAFLSELFRFWLGNFLREFRGITEFITGIYLIYVREMIEKMVKDFNERREKKS